MRDDEDPWTRDGFAASQPFRSVSFDRGRDVDLAGAW
jgi:hypothetical protein